MKKRLTILATLGLMLMGTIIFAAAYANHVKLQAAAQARRLDHLRSELRSAAQRVREPGRIWKMIMPDAQWMRERL